jgi:hypothetical protein
MIMECRFIGIDPGKSGYVVILDILGNIVDHFPVPKIGNAYDKNAMAHKLRHYSEVTKIGSMFHKVHAVLEDVHANIIGGKASNFDLGNGKGLWEMGLMAYGISHTMVAPKDWQKYMWQGVKIQYKPTKRITKAGNAVSQNDTKATSLLAAKSLQPEVDWRVIGKKGDPTTKIDDGFVDAYLMAEYCRRKFR